MHICGADPQVCAGRPRPARPSGRFAPLFAVLLLTGCGYVGDPLPPLINVPARVQSLSVVERGARILVQFTMPDKTTEGATIKTSLQADVRIGSGSGPDWEPQSKPATQVSITNAAAQFEIPVADWVGKDVTVGVRVTGPNGRTSDWSYVSFPVVHPLPTPQAFQAQGVPEGIQLSWQGPEGDYRIYRKAGDAKAFSKAVDVHAREWVDRDTEYGAKYAWFVRQILKTNDKYEAESEASTEVTLTPADIFPPAAPRGLRADAAAGSVELSWEADTETDLAGYRVYRSTEGGEFQKVADLGLVPAYSDRAVERGKTYRYAVSAFDKTGNESARSPAVEVRVE